jgi:GAF domain-containing protein
MSQAFPHDGFTNVAFVELPDEALDLFSRLTQRSGTQVLLVVSNDQDNYAIRMAEILQIPVLDYPNRLSLIGCDTVIVGPYPEDSVDEVREMLSGTEAEVYSVEEAFRILGITPPTEHQISDSNLHNVGDLSQLFAEEERRRHGPDASDPEDGPPPEEPAPWKGSRQRDFEIRQPGESNRPATPTAPENGPPKVPVPVPVPAPSPVPAPFPVPAPSSVAGPAAPPRRPGPLFPAEAVEDDAVTLPDAPTEGFDPGPLLGDDLREQLGSLSLDGSGNLVLKRILDTALHATHCQSGSIMLPDQDQEHLKITVAEGMPDDAVKSVRQRIDEGVAGDVFRNGATRLLHGRTRPPAADKHLRPRLRQAAVIPILHEGRSIGVLCVNQETEHRALTDASVALLERFAKEISSGIFKALKLDTLENDHRMGALLRQCERLMALDESLSHRLIAAGEAMKKALGAEFVHVFVVDPLGQRLELITPRRGATMVRPEYMPMGRGMFGWVARRGRPRTLTLWDEDTREGAATYLIPIQAEFPRGLIVLENAPTAAEHDAPKEAALHEIIVRVAEIIEVEKNLEAQELLSQLEMRVGEQSSRFAGLLPRERARAVLEFMVELLAGETAAWIPKPGAPAVWSRPTGPKNAAIQGEFKKCLDGVARWMGDRDEAAGGAALAGWDAQAPCSVAPYLCVRGRNGDLVLLSFPFEETLGTLAQIPVSILYALMRKLTGYMPADLSGPRESGERAA